MIRDNDNNTVKSRVTRDSDDNKVKIRTRKEYQQQPKRTREQAINDKYILKQQVDCQVCLLDHNSDCGSYEKDNDDDINNNGYNNNTQDADTDTYTDTDADDSAVYEDKKKKRERERERAKCEQEQKEENRKRFKRIKDDNDPYADDTGISGNIFSTRHRIQCTTRNKTTQKCNPKQ